ncbi:MAG TPA: glycosyltransferase family 1 protein [Chlorobiota bacterium]|mgnify:FL=1|nr:glycosyltransferase family 1 protein [Chlorobiota bacterium]
MNPYTQSTTIGVNARLLVPGRLEGLGWYTFEILRRLVTLRPKATWIFYFDRPFDPSFVFADNVRGVVIHPPARHPILWHIWMAMNVPRAVRRDKCDVVLSLEGLMPLSCHVPSVNVIHDLGFVHEPSHLPWMVRAYYDYHFRRAAREATVLGTISEWSRADVTQRYGRNPSEMFLVPNAIRDGFEPLEEREQDIVRAELTAGRRYFVHVGLLQPRKNIQRLMQAYDLYRKRGGNLSLVLAGRKGWALADMERTFESLEFKHDIHFTGYVEDKRLQRIVASAEALVFVPTYEGFGVPVIEAMACGIPVVASRTSSIPEVAGSAAILVDPMSVLDIAQGMIDVTSDPVLRKNLRERGLVRAKDFSWNRSAEIVNAMIDVALRSGQTSSQR